MFCSLSDLANYLQIDIPNDKESSALLAIEMATAAIRNYCGQYLSYVKDDKIVLDGNGRSKLFLPEIPVVAVSQVIEDDEELEEDDYQFSTNGVLHRVDDYWSSGFQNIEVEYSHGYKILPDSIVVICIRAAARAYQAGLRAEEMGGVPGVSAKSLGDFSVSFGSEQSVGAGEAVLGASAAPLLLKAEKEILSRYRYVAL
jgi:hypothetical protein